MTKQLSPITPPPELVGPDDCAVVGCEQISGAVQWGAQQ
jgi:hypothetical protein